MQIFHLDTSVLIEREIRKKWLTKASVREGRVKLKVSQFALSELFTLLKGKRKHDDDMNGINDLIEGCKNGTLDVFVLKKEHWDVFTGYIRDLWKDVDHLGLVDLLIVASAFSDPECICLLTIDGKMLNSKVIKDVRDKVNIERRDSRLPDIRLRDASED
ncbi:MAG: hypothetical protein QXV05_05155 [Candidatus Korarchaeum sp.]